MAFEGAQAELYKAHQTGLEKYTYFLLAAAGTAIGFAVQKTEGARLSWWLLPVGLSTLAWAGSFVCGCKNINFTNATLNANMTLLKITNGLHPDPRVPHEMFVEVSRDVAIKNAVSAQRFAAWQFRLLVIGAVFFIAWRIAEMFRIS